MPNHFLRIDPDTVAINVVLIGTKYVKWSLATVAFDDCKILVLIELYCIL